MEMKFNLPEADRVIQLLKAWIIIFYGKQWSGAPFYSIPSWCHLMILLHHDIIRVCLMWHIPWYTSSISITYLLCNIQTLHSMSQPNARGLIHTLVTEAIKSEKSREEIKDLLRLKLCNANIHTYTSHFMDILQQEKESSASYIHSLKTEARWCNFTKDAATIRIFVKGLKNAHNLATCIYKKGPQSLTDATSEVEKLSGAQQLTATIISPWTVSVMSNKEHCCFQYQEPTHITWCCPHNGCYKFDKYGHIIMGCPHRIPPFGTPVTHQKSHKSHYIKITKQ